MRVRTSTWYETKIKYQKMMEDGSEKVVNENYMLLMLFLAPRQKHLSLKK